MFRISTSREIETCGFWGLRREGKWRVIAKEYGSLLGGQAGILKLGCSDGY